MKYAWPIGMDCEQPCRHAHTWQDIVYIKYVDLASPMSAPYNKYFFCFSLKRLLWASSIVLHVQRLYELWTWMNIPTRSKDLVQLHMGCFKGKFFDQEGGHLHKSISFKALLVCWCIHEIDLLAEQRKQHWRQALAAFPPACRNAVEVNDALIRISHEEKQRPYI